MLKLTKNKSRPLKEKKKVLKMVAQTDLLQVRWKLFVMGKLLRNTKILVSRCGG